MNKKVIESDIEIKETKKKLLKVEFVSRYNVGSYAQGESLFLASSLNPVLKYIVGDNYIFTRDDLKKLKNGITAEQLEQLKSGKSIK